MIEEICAVVAGPVSAEVTALDHEKMLAEGRYLARIAPNVTIKVPLTIDGLKTCKALSDEGTPVNVTLCFSPAQALLAAKKQWDAGGNAEDFSRAKARILEGG